MPLIEPSGAPIGLEGVEAYGRAQAAMRHIEQLATQAPAFVPWKHVEVIDPGGGLVLGACQEGDDSTVLERTWTRPEGTSWSATHDRTSAGGCAMGA